MMYPGEATSLVVSAVLSCYVEATEEIRGVCSNFFVLKLLAAGRQLNKKCFASSADAL